MRIALIFASTEGQTCKIAQYVQAYLIAEDHHTALISADAAMGLDLSPFDGVILAGSVHAGRYQPALVQASKAHANTLNAIPSLFLSVSLAAAGDAAEDWKELAAIVDRFKSETGWAPGRVEHVAGAFRFKDLSFVKYWALRWIETQKDPDAVPGEDKEYTDWGQL